MEPRLRNVAFLECVLPIPEGWLPQGRTLDHGGVRLSPRMAVNAAYTKW